MSRALDWACVGDCRRGLECVSNEHNGRAGGRAAQGDGEDPPRAGRRAPLIYVQSWEEPRVERLVQHFAKTFFGQPVPFGVWSVVDGLLVDGMPGSRHPRPAEGARRDPPGVGEGLLPPQGFPVLVGLAARDHPAAPRPLPRAEGPRPARADPFAAAEHPRGPEEGDLRHRVRAARRSRDHAHHRRERPPPPRPGVDRRPGDEASRARDARADGGRDRPPARKGLRAAQDVRRVALSGGPRREGADVEEGGRARVRAAPVLPRGHRRLRDAEDVAAQAAVALFEGGAGRGHPDSPRGSS